MSYHWLDCRSSFDHFSLHYTAFLFRPDNLDIRHFHTLVAPIRNWDFCLAISQDSNLLQGLDQCVTSRGVSLHGSHTHQSAFLQSYSQRHFDTKLLRVSGLAFGDAFDVRSILGIEFNLVLEPLGKNTMNSLQHCFDLGAGIVWYVADLQVFQSNRGLERAQRLLLRQ